MSYVPVGVKGTTLSEIADSVNQELLKIEEVINTFPDVGTLIMPIANAPARHRAGRCVIILPDAVDAWGTEFSAGAWISDGSQWHQIVEFQTTGGN